MSAAELKRERERAGLTRTQLAAAIGRSERIIYHYEAGKVEILQANEMAIRQVLAATLKVKPGRKPAA